MADLNALNAIIKDSGMTIEAIAERADMKRYTLDRRLKGEGEFTASEIVGLTKALRLKLSERNKIFLT
jgi:DNA-binding phage protein